VFVAILRARVDFWKRAGRLEQRALCPLLRKRRDLVKATMESKRARWPRKKNEKASEIRKK
jgi:hypothetical protein